MIRMADKMLYLKGYLWIEYSEISMLIWSLRSAYRVHSESTGSDGTSPLFGLTVIHLTGILAQPLYRERADSAAGSATDRHGLGC